MKSYLNNIRHNLCNLVCLKDKVELLELSFALFSFFCMLFYFLSIMSLLFSLSY